MINVKNKIKILYFIFLWVSSDMTTTLSSPPPSPKQPSQSDFLTTVREWLRLYSDASSSSSFVQEAVCYIQDTSTLSIPAAVAFLQRLESVDENILPSLTLSKSFWRTEAVLACSEALALRPDASDEVFVQCLHRILKMRLRIQHWRLENDKCENQVEEKALTLLEKSVYPYSWMAAEAMWDYFLKRSNHQVQMEMEEEPTTTGGVVLVSEWLKKNPLPLNPQLKQVFSTFSESDSSSTQDFHHDPENVHRTGIVVQLRHNLLELRNAYYACLGSSLHREAFSLEWLVVDDDILRHIYTDTTVFYLDPKLEVFPITLYDAWRYIVVAVRSSSSKINPQHFADRLHEECRDDFTDVCFMGRLSRLVNALSGLHPSLALRIPHEEAMRYRWRHFVQEYTLCLPEEAREELLLGMISTPTPSKERMKWIETLRYMIPEFLWQINDQDHDQETRVLNSEVLRRILRQEDPSLPPASYS